MSTPTNTLAFHGDSQLTAELREADEINFGLAMSKLFLAKAAISTRDMTPSRWQFYALRMAEFVDALTLILPECDDLIEQRNMWLEEAGMFTQDQWPEDLMGNRAHEDGLYIPLADRRKAA